LKKRGGKRPDRGERPYKRGQRKILRSRDWNVLEKRQDTPKPKKREKDSSRKADILGGPPKGKRRGGNRDESCRNKPREKSLKTE